MKKIIFLAPYPNEVNIKEGMMQRVDAIDRLFSGNDYEKVYIVPQFKRITSSRKEVALNTTELHLSIWSSFGRLLKLLQSADIIYCHSLYGMSPFAILFLPFIKNKNIIWDLHGIIPEELHLSRAKKTKLWVYRLVEYQAIRNVRKVILVTDAMGKHLRTKYPYCKAQFLTYPILPATIEDNIEIDTLEQPEINIIYAGNMQGYQNIPRMVESIKKIVKYSYVHFFILTGQKNEMVELFSKNGLASMSNITIKTVLPTELSIYYRKAHYGYILRDDINVNNVACPTKMVEYLAYGITAIILHRQIGDFEETGYDFINLNDFSIENLKGMKSIKNREIYLQLTKKSSSKELLDFITK